MHLPNEPFWRWWTRMVPTPEPQVEPQAEPTSWELTQDFSRTMQQLVNMGHANRRARRQRRR